MPKVQQGAAKKASRSSGKSMAGKPTKPALDKLPNTQETRLATSDHGEQIAPEASTRNRRHAQAGASGYVRLRIRMDEGEMSIVDTHHVDSELELPSALHGGNAYDVTLGDRLLHADSVPDVGVSRSYPNPDPDAPIEQRHHHFHLLSTYEFDVRVPLADLTPADLGKVEIAYYRVKEHPDRAIGAQPLGRQYPRELREMSRIVGLPPDLLGSRRSSRSTA
jgi:hypothetical protein